VPGGTACGSCGGKKSGAALFEPSTPEASEEALAAMGEHVPYLVAMAAEAAHGTTGRLGFCDYQAEFEFGLDLVLEGLDRLNAAS
jgi:hypothetical protein